MRPLSHYFIRVLAICLLVSCNGRAQPQNSSVSISMGSLPSAAAVSPTPAPVLSAPQPDAIQIKDMTPPELKDKPLYALAVSSENPPVLYGLSSQGKVYTWREHQPPDEMVLNDHLQNVLAVDDALYYLNNSCVKKFSILDRVTSVVAGSCDNYVYGLREGAALQALFNQPNGLARDASGRMYIADSHNLRVRKIENDQVTTYVGNWIATNNPTEGLNYGCLAGVCVAGTLTDRISNIYYFITGEAAGEPIQPAISVNYLDGSGRASHALPIVQDGPRSQATFWRPQQLELDNQGNLYVFDYIARQQHIRKIRRISGTKIPSGIMLCNSRRVVDVA